MRDFTEDEQRQLAACEKLIHDEDLSDEAKVKILQFGIKKQRERLGILPDGTEEESVT